MGLLYKILCVACLLLIVVISFGSLFLKKWLRDRASKKPFCEPQLRPAGESLRLALSKNDDASIYVIIGYVGSASLAYSMVELMPVKNVESPYLLAMISALLCVSVLFILFFTIRLWTLLGRSWALHLGYEGERFVGQVLTDTLIPMGCKVFHDIPFDGFNIDHLVVSPCGIFVIETKTRRKPINKETGKPEYKIVYDGKKLVFPKGMRAYGALDQAQFNAKEVQKWLGGETGESIPVRAVLLFPGWFVENTGNGPVVVTSPKYLLPRIYPSGVACVNDGVEMDQTLLNRILYIVSQRATITES